MREFNSEARAQIVVDSSWGKNGASKTDEGGLLLPLRISSSFATSEPIRFINGELCHCKISDERYNPSEFIADDTRR